MTPELNWLSDPTVFAVNRLDAHSDHVCYRTVQEAAQRHSSLRQPLDGMWRFVWSSCPAQRPADFWREGADLSGFGTIRVPGHMETQGYGQLQYTNTLYPWDGRSALRPPQVDLNDDPVGSYAREFDLDAGLRAAGMHQLPGCGTGHVPVVQWQVRGLCRGQLYPLGI